MSAYWFTTRVGGSCLQHAILVGKQFLKSRFFLKSHSYVIIPVGFHSTTIKEAISAKKFLFTKRFQGLPQLDNFSLEKEELPELKPGGMNNEEVHVVQCSFLLVYVFFFHRCPL